jgi:hypothetical protein
VESAEDRAAKAAKAVAEKTNGRAPMSWADVIGAAEEVINDKTDGK